ncbi:MAG: glutamate 5-kinase [Solobacterium sp.]|nr:glutamate 5-kinase [Solobacterium sp.]
MEYKRIVVKVGTSTVCHSGGTPNLRRIERLSMVLSDIKNSGADVVLVTSGAIGAGIHKAGWTKRPDSLPAKQAAAAIGQCELMSIYDRFFREYGSITAQILLTKDVLEESNARHNCMATFGELLAMHIIPIVNENDSVATEEIVYGDNDTLSAAVAELIGADLLILLSDIDGLYDADPSECPDARHLDTVTDLNAVRHLAKGSHSSQGTGGMVTKLRAADIAMNAHIPVVIANGRDPDILYDITDGKKIGTLFVPKESV